MITTKRKTFIELVWEACGIVGKRPPAIADIVMSKAFPETVRVARIEEAFKLFRAGVVDEVTRIIRASDDPRQSDFADIDPRFLPIVGNLNSRAYYVVSEQRQVDLRELIQRPALLDDARKFMRQKGRECLNEAKTLDRLYNAVMRAR